MGPKYSTELHLIYRIVDSKLEIFGLFETRERAEENLNLMNARGWDWQIADVNCVAWGIVNGVVSRNGPLGDFDLVALVKDQRYLDTAWIDQPWEKE